MAIFNKKSEYPSEAGGNGNGTLPGWEMDEKYLRILEKIHRAKKATEPLKVAVGQAQAAELELQRAFEKQELLHIIEQANAEDVERGRKAWNAAKAETKKLTEQLAEAERALEPLKQAQAIAAEEAQAVTFPRSARIILARCEKLEVAVNQLKLAQEDLAEAVKAHRGLPDRGGLPSTFSGYILHPSAFQKNYGPGLLAVGVEELQKVVRRLEKRLEAGA